eukprot:Rhum_TRINITY_DN15456_c3_g1::Rhum_TRINITY_DN15456_c3_g1_i2::g.157321::m.157321
MKRLVALCAAAAYVAAQCDSKLAHCPDEFPTEEHPNPDKNDPCATTDCRTGLNTWQVERILSQHNLFRAKHGACPMTYNKEVEEYIVGSPGFVETCTAGKLEHNDMTPYGENIAMQVLEARAHTWDVAASVAMWYCMEEGCYNYGDPDASTGTVGHLTQVLWKSSLEIGCAVCSKSRGTSTWISMYLMCGYKEPGNGGDFTKSVFPLDTTPVCAKDECEDKPCGAGQTCNDPNKADKLNDFVCTCTSD